MFCTIFLCFRLKFMNKETQKTFKVCCAGFAVVIYKHLFLHADELCPCLLLNTTSSTHMAKWMLAPRILNFVSKWRCVLIFALRSLYDRGPLNMKLGGPLNRAARSVGRSSLAMPVLEWRWLGRPIRSLDTVPPELTQLLLRLWGVNYEQPDAFSSAEPVWKWWRHYCLRFPREKGQTGSWFPHSCGSVTLVYLNLTLQE